jgi:hypothetical protein
MSLKVNIGVNFSRNHDWAAKNLINNFNKLNNILPEVLNARILPGQQTPGSSKFDNPQSLGYAFGEWLNPTEPERPPATAVKRPGAKKGKPVKAPKSGGGSPVVSAIKNQNKGTLH